MSAPAAAPQRPRYAPDLWEDAALREPHEHYRALRDLGPVVHLDATDLLVVPRYAEVRHVLAHPEVFVSGQGVCLNGMSNAVAAGQSVLHMDGEDHAFYRGVVAGALTPKRLRPLRAGIEERADALVRGLLDRGDGSGVVVDGVADLARALPLAVVPDLVGWPEAGRESLLDWAGALFDVMGPPNERAVGALGHVDALQQFTHRVSEAGDLAAGSVGADVLRRAAAGELPPERCPMLLLDYLGPSLDTTISAIGSAVALLATHPEQWARLRADPDLVPRAVDEVVRLESPISGFTRVAVTDTELAGAPVRAQERVLVSYASANRDERHWGPGADTFDVTRDATSHVGMGSGTHGCAGQGLARLEVAAVLRALLRHVAHLEPAGEPTRAVNNLIRAWATLPVRLVAA
ncbi:cytochrome P450 [Rhodococcus aerolatus]